MCNDRSDQHHHGSFNHLNKIDRRDVVLGGGALLTATALAGVALPDLANAQVPKPGADPTPGFNNKIPDKIMTPDKVETRIGTLNFVDGVPTAETAQKVYDHLDFLRGVEVFLNFIPAASLESVRLGHVVTQHGAKRKTGSQKCVAYPNWGLTTACSRRLTASAALRLPGAAEAQRYAVAVSYERTSTSFGGEDQRNPGGLRRTQPRGCAWLCQRVRPADRAHRTVRLPRRWCVSRSGGSDTAHIYRARDVGRGRLRTTTVHRCREPSHCVDRCTSETQERNAMAGKPYCGRLHLPQRQGHRVSHVRRRTAGNGLGRRRSLRSDRTYDVTFCPRRRGRLRPRAGHRITRRCTGPRPPNAYYHSAGHRRGRGQ